MSHFYGSIKGMAKTEATRRGGKTTGISAHTRGWNLGIKVLMGVDGDGQDIAYVYQTGGSNKPSETKLVKAVKVPK